MIDLLISDLREYRKRAELISQLIKETPGPKTFTVNVRGGGASAFTPERVEYDGISLGWLHDGLQPSWVGSYATVEYPGYPSVEDLTLLVKVSEYRVIGHHTWSRGDAPTVHTKQPGGIVVGIPTAMLSSIKPLKEGE